MAKAKKKSEKKKLTQAEAVAYQKYLNSLSEEKRKALQKEVDDVANAGAKSAAKEAKKRVVKYYAIKGEIEDALIEKLDAAELPLINQATKDSNPWSATKILKIITNLPAKMPEKDEGYITAARNIEVGKRKPISKEQQEERKKKAAARKQEKLRGELFQKDVSDRKANAKKKAPAKKKASTK